MNERAKSREELVDQVRAYQQKVTGWLNQTLPFWRKDDDYTESGEYQIALEAYQQFKKAEEVEYSPVVTYARDLYDRCDKSDKSLDEKADSIIR